MSYLVFCVFDLKGANREDYLYAYMDLDGLGLRKTVSSEGLPPFELPTRAVMGMIEGRNIDDVRTAVGKRVQDAFKARGLRANFFIVVCGDWACAGEAM
jgi:hypothetical protein